ncbi:ankyrin repeat domain-containing protein [Sphingomonas swuensis]|uniref:ankyrin repeat domain-containing protein n=1 Tax=Sphingomonas swuensis TaxID=977800 RepID=UPI0031DED15C
MTALCLGAIALPASAQFANSGYSFVQAVRERDGTKATQLLDAPGSNVINFRDDKGESALHVVAGARDLQFMRFILGRRADPNLGNRSGDTPLVIASRIGFLDGVDLLLRNGAQVDKANRLGETALIIAVQQRQLPVVRRLLESGANPDRTDNATGRSARDYAKVDSRGAELLRMMDSARPKTPSIVSGPKL